MVTGDVLISALVSGWAVAQRGQPDEGGLFGLRNACRVCGAAAPNATLKII